MDAKWIKKTITAVGNATRDIVISLFISIVLFGMAVSLLVGCCIIKEAVENPHIKSGVVYGRSYDSGKTTFSSYCFGDWTITKQYTRSGESYWIIVDNGKSKEMWRVTREQYYKLQIGEYVDKKEIVVIETKRYYGE